MSGKWRLTVEGFGRIERADVEIRPLTLLIGENNSGKSYLATLLWGLVAVGWELPSPDGPELAACTEWAKACLPPAVPRFERALKEDEAEMFQRLFDAALDAGKEALLERLFQSKKIRAQSIWLRSIESPSEIRWTHGYDPDLGHTLRRTTPRQDETFTVFGPDHERAAKIAVAALRSGVVLRDSAPSIGVLGRGTNRFQPGDPIFVPASRTGYMHLYREVARQRFEVGPREGANGDVALTLPAFHFLDFVAFGANLVYKFYEDACSLIESALTGHIELSAGRGANEVHYVMKGLVDRLSMPLSSALVSELAPLLLVLRGAYPLRLLILEEPESHLHPRLQRVAARAIVRLIRKGVVVVVTTHSESFCQQINNFIKLGALPVETRRRAHARLAYEEADYLLADEVAGHQFDIGDDGRTRVTELTRSEYGIAMPPFNRELAKLSEEVLFLQDLLANNNETS
jgi:energy-coupling factor transporter ATP-binding protein EcfA2